MFILLRKIVQDKYLYGGTEASATLSGQERRERSPGGGDWDACIVEGRSLGQEEW